MPPYTSNCHSGPPGERLWRLSRYWIEYTEIQEVVQEGICSYWLDNVDTTIPLVTWDAFKAWTQVSPVPVYAISGTLSLYPN